MKKESIQLGQVEVRFLLEPDATGGSLAMFEFRVFPGAKVPVPHYHKDYDETVYGIQGVVTFTVEGEKVDVGPGDCLFIPRGAIHGFINQSNSETVTLAVITPALLNPDFFREMAVIINAGGPPDIEKVKTVMLKHGLVPVLPQVTSCNSQ